MTINPSTPAGTSASGNGDKYDAIFGVLADQRRRRSLRYLLNSDTSTTVDELATELETWESRSPGTGPDSGSIDGIRTSLVHVHLPKMDDAAVIDYNSQKQTITSGTHSELAREQFEAMRQ